MQVVHLVKSAYSGTDQMKYRFSNSSAYTWILNCCLHFCDNSKSFPKIIKKAQPNFTAYHTGGARAGCSLLQTQATAKLLVSLVCIYIIYYTITWSYFQVVDKHWQSILKYKIKVEFAWTFNFESEELCYGCGELKTSVKS